MIRTNLLTMLVFITLVFGLAQTSEADWGVSFGVGYSNAHSIYSVDRISSEYRRGYQMDDWVERGNSSVTESPIFPDGVRLSAWATYDESDYEYAIASAIYYFEIPKGARSIRIKIYYDGKPDRDDLDNPIVGRVWIKRTIIGDDFEEYYPREGRYESLDAPLYGDTFVLPASKHLEVIKISARDHVDDDGMMELHVVAEGSQRIDVKYIEVESYSSEPGITVITRYYGDYLWRPWYHYTYWYFYTGPMFYFSDYYYIRYTYPYYRRYYVEVRKEFDSYLRIYYVRRPHRHIRWVEIVRIEKGTPRNWSKDRLRRWSQELDEVRRSYEITSMKTRRPEEIREVRERVRSVLSISNSTAPSLSRSTSSSAQIQVESATQMKKRREDTRSSISHVRDTTTYQMRTRTSEEQGRGLQSQFNLNNRIETRQDDQRTKQRRVIEQSSQRNEDVRRIQARIAESLRRALPTKDRNDSQVKQRRETTREEVRKEQVRQVEPAPARQNQKVETDEDDEDEKEKERSSGETSTRKRIRGR